MSQDAEDGLDQLLGSWNSHARPTIVVTPARQPRPGLRSHEVRAEPQTGEGGRPGRGRTARHRRGRGQTHRGATHRIV